MLEVVAGVVLPERRQPVPDPAVRQHHLEPEREVARIAVAQHAGAARVGGQVAADPRRPLAAEREGEQAAGLGGGFLDVGQDHPGLDGDRVVERVDLAHPVEPREAQDQLPPGPIRRGRAAEPGIAALRNDGDFLGRAQRDDAGDLFDGRRANHRRRRAAIPFPLVHQIGRHVRRLGQQAARADDADQALAERILKVRVHA